MAVQESFHDRHILQAGTLQYLQSRKLERGRSNTKLLFREDEVTREVKHLSRRLGRAVNPDKNKHVVILGGGFAGNRTN